MHTRIPGAIRVIAFAGALLIPTLTCVAQSVTPVQPQPHGNTRDTRRV